MLLWVNLLYLPDKGLLFFSPPTATFINPAHLVYLSGVVEHIDKEGAERFKMVRPEKVFKVGACRASVFRNEVLKGGKRLELPKVVFQVRYKDRDGRWKGTNSLSINDLPDYSGCDLFEYEYGFINPRLRETSETPRRVSQT